MQVLAFATRHRVVLAAVFLLVFPLLLPFRAIAVNILIYGLFAVGFNMLYGYLGLLSFGHAALFGGGAYACGIALTHFGLPWWAGLLIGVVGGAVVAGLMGAFAVRTRGIYFAMVTLALAQCVYYIAYQATGWTGGENGLRDVRFDVIGCAGVQPGRGGPADAVLRGGGVRDRGAVRAVADPGVAVRGGDGGGAGERGAGAGVRL